MCIYYFNISFSIVTTTAILGHIYFFFYNYSICQTEARDICAGVELRCGYIPTSDLDECLLGCSVLLWVRYQSHPVLKFYVLYPRDSVCEGNKWMVFRSQAFGYNGTGKPFASAKVRSPLAGKI